MPNAIEHINTDENKEQISLQELQGALKNWFFDKKENADAIGKELNVMDANLKNTLVEWYKQYLNSLTPDQCKALFKNQWSVWEKKLFQLASMASLWITTIDNKPISVDWVIWKQWRTLLNLLYVGAIDIYIYIYQWAERKQELVNIMSQLTTKLDANNLTLFDILPWNKEYITTLFAKDPVLLSQAIQSCPDFRIFSTNYTFWIYLAEYIATWWQLTSETKLILEQWSKLIKQKEQQQVQQQQFEKRKLQLDTIPGEIKKIEWSLATTSQELQTQKDAYNIVYKEFCELLKQNNTRYEKAKNIAPLALVVALPWIGRTLTGKVRSALNTDEQKQLDSYTKLKKSYDAIVTTEKKISSYKTQIETKQQEMQYGYYELVREFGNQKDADQALVNLVAQYGIQVQKKYPQAISEATTRVSEPQRLVLQANKTQLDVYMKRKETTIDIAQQVLWWWPVRFQSCNQEDIAHLWLWQVKNLLSIEEQNQAIMNAWTIAVRDNTAVARHRQTTENVMENGNIVGQKAQYHYTDGKTSTAWYEIENQYRLASEKFKYLTIPGMGTILAKIEPAFYNQLQSVKLEKNQKLIFQPRHNKEFSCFDIDASCVLIGWKDSKWTIWYKSLWQEKISYIQNSEYQSLLQVKEWYGTLLKQDEKVKQVSDYMANLQQTAGGIQQLANVYAQTPGDEILSQTIMGDITKTWWLKSQIEWLKWLLSRNGKYQSVIDMIIANKSWVYDRYEHELHGLQEQLTSLTKYTEQLDKLLAYSVREWAESRQVKEFMIQVVAIAAGVLAAVATWWAGGFLVTTAISTAAGMAGARLTQEAFARWTDTRWMTNDLHSDIGKCMNGQAKRSEVLPKVWMEFAQWFATTAMFIGAGRVIGTQLEKFVLANAGTASREVKLAHKVRKSISKLNDSEIQLLEQRWFSQFVKKFWKEFTQEMWEEWVQQWADKIDSRLWGLVSMISCISGKRSYHAWKTEVFIEGFDNQTHTTTVSYVGDVHNIQTDLATTAWWAWYNFTSSENGIVTYTKITDGVTESLIFKPTQESISMKSLDLGEHAKIYDIHHNKTENGEYHYNYSKLQDGNNDLTIYLARNGLVMQWSIHEDWSFTMIDQNWEKIHFAKTNEVKPEQVQEKKPQWESGADWDEEKNKWDIASRNQKIEEKLQSIDNQNLEVIDTKQIQQQIELLIKLGCDADNFIEWWKYYSDYWSKLLILSATEIWELQWKVTMVNAMWINRLPVFALYWLNNIKTESLINLKTIEPYLNQLWFKLSDISCVRIDRATETTIEEIQKVIALKPILENLWIKIRVEDIPYLSKLSTDQIQKLLLLKPWLDILWIVIEAWNINVILEWSIDEVQDWIKRWDHFEKEEKENIQYLEIGSPNLYFKYWNFNIWDKIDSEVVFNWTTTTITREILDIKNWNIVYKQSSSLNQKLIWTFTLSIDNFKQLQNVTRVRKIENVQNRQDQTTLDLNERNSQYFKIAVVNNGDWQWRTTLWGDQTNQPDAVINQERTIWSENKPKIFNLNRLPKTIDEFNQLFDKLGTDVRIIFEKLKWNYVKLDKNRTVPVRFWTQFDSIEAEFRALQQMYQISPNNAPKPLALIRCNGKVVWYTMEKIKWKTLQEKYWESWQIPLDIQEKILELFSNFHIKWIIHWDLHSNNIMITDSWEIKIIDPIWYVKGNRRVGNQWRYLSEEDVNALMKSDYDYLKILCKDYISNFETKFSNRDPKCFEYWESCSPYEKTIIFKLNQYPNIPDYWLFTPSVLTTFIQSPDILENIDAWVWKISKSDSPNWLKDNPQKFISKYGIDELCKDPNIVILLSNSLNYWRKQLTYCTTAMPTFIDSLINNSWLHIVDKDGNKFYVKSDKYNKSALSIKWNNIEFWTICDLWLFLAKYRNDSLESNPEQNTQEKMEAFNEKFKWLWLMTYDSNTWFKLQINQTLSFESVKAFYGCIWYWNQWVSIDFDVIAKMEWFQQFTILFNVIQNSQENLSIDNIKKLLQTFSDYSTSPLLQTHWEVTDYYFGVLIKNLWFYWNTEISGLTVDQKINIIKNKIQQGLEVLNRNPNIIHDIVTGNMSDFENNPNFILNIINHLNHYTTNEHARD